MANKRARPLIVGAVLVFVFLILRIILPKLLPEETGQGAAFFATLFAILSAYICGIAFLSRALSGKISQRVFGLVEKIFIAGILLGAGSLLDRLLCFVCLDLVLHRAGLRDAQECA